MNLRPVRLAVLAVSLAFTLWGSPLFPVRDSTLADAATVCYQWGVIAYKGVLFDHLRFSFDTKGGPGRSRVVNSS